MGVYRNNTAAKFTTILPSRIDLDGDWEVALYEIALPARFENVAEDAFWMTMNETRVALPAGRYEHVVDVLSALAKLMHDDPRLPNVNLYVVSHDRPSDMSERIVNVVYEEDRQKVSLLAPRGTRLNLSEGLADALGFGARNFILTSLLRADRPARIRRTRAHPTAYVYTDVVRAVVVGDTQVRLLRTVNMDVDDRRGGGDGADDVRTIHHVYASPLYVPLGKKHFESIEIDIMTDTGETMPFVEGKSVVVLHFRRASNPHFLPR